MKHLFIIVFIIIASTLNAQQKLDTIYANEHKNVALFFPKPIRQGITGASNFVFTYNREKEQYFGLLQAQPGQESNLIAVTNDGQVYSYILKYKKELHKLNYFVGARESIGNEVRKAVKKKLNIQPSYENRNTFFKGFSKYLLKKSLQNIATKRKKGLKLQLQRKVHYGSEVFLVMEFINNSEIDFEIDYLNVYRVNGNKKRRASYQKLKQDVIFKYQFPSIVKKGQSKRFVFVLPKFVLGDNEKMELEIQELKGTRKLVLETKN